MFAVCVRISLSQHEGRCHWLNDDKFLRDLESDSVDSETLDEELRSLELHETNTSVSPQTTTALRLADRLL